MTLSQLARRKISQDSTGVPDALCLHPDCLETLAPWWSCQHLFGFLDQNSVKSIILERIVPEYPPGTSHTFRPLHEGEGPDTCFRAILPDGRKHSILWHADAYSNYTPGSPITVETAWSDARGKFIDPLTGENIESEPDGGIRGWQSIDDVLISIWEATGQ